MRQMTKSAVALAREALALGERALPRYSSRFSRHAYTQPQLFALLALKQFLQTDYRGVVTLVAEWSEVRQALGLTRVPHYSTLCYAHERLLRGAEKGGASSGPRPPSPGAPPRSASSPTRRRSRRSRSTRPGSKRTG